MSTYTFDIPVGPMVAGDPLPGWRFTVRDMRGRIHGRFKSMDTAWTRACELGVGAKVIADGYSTLVVESPRRFFTMGAAP